MQRFMIFFIAFTCFFFSALVAQKNPRFELSTSFPFHAFQSSPRDYFLTTKYSAGVSFTINDYADFISTITYTQQNAIMTQVPSYRTGALVDSRTIFVPFTSDPFFTEYGAFTGVRLVTNKNIAQVFIKGQLGLLAAKYGTIQNVSYIDHNNLPGGYSTKEVEGDVINFQMAAIYGGGIILNPTTSLSLILDLHAINRFTKQSLDVYKSVGVQFGL
jgi:hypothetical protein